MKSKSIKLNRYHVTPFSFVLLIVAALISTAINGLMYKEEDIKNLYSSYLNGDYSYVNKAKSALLTGKETIQTLDSVIPFKDDMINIFGLVQKSVGSNYINDMDSNNDIAKLKNGKIVFLINKNNKRVKKGINNLTAFSEYLEGEGIDYLFVQAPYKISQKNDLLPTGVKDFANANADALLSGIDANGVNTFDLRDEIDNKGIDHYSLFFATDHHWKPTAGLWATREICKKLNSDFGFSIDTSILEDDKFSSTVYENIFLGSQGKRVGKYYAGTDNFTLLLPKYETSISHYMLRKNGTQKKRSGDFENSMIFKANLEPVDYFKKNTYATYSGGDYQLEIIKNYNLKGKKIVLLRDSFSCVVSPFLSLAACRELHTIDPRHYEGSIKEYIEKVNPDIVISLHNPDYQNGYFELD
ncbi:MAG: hypothetical protein GX824_04795, partial [Clostridiales bacterium]|nr:hypothetical protein [Clostridiales bacterium]